MKSLKWFLLSFLGLLLFNACDTEKDCPVNPLDDGSQVKFQATIGASGLRATGTTWDAGDAIGVYALNGGATLPGGVYQEKENIKYTTPGDGIFSAATIGISFPETGALDFVAYYPYQSVVNNHTYAINVANQSDPATVDLLYSNNAKGATIANPTVGLQFKHMLSMLVLNVAAGDGVASLDGLNVSVRGLKTDGTFNLANAAITTGETTGNISASVAISGTSATVSAILVPGQGLDEAKIVFSLAGQVYEWIPEDMLLESGKKYTYTIQLSTTGVTLLQPNATIIDWEDANTGSGSIILTPEEGGEEGLITVAQLRSMHTGANVTVNDDVKIKAVVIQSLAGGNSTSKKNIVVQDETGGIAIRFVDDTEAFDFGDEVEINLQGQQLSAYNGLLQINNLVNANATKIGTKTVTAKEITAAQLLSGNYESQYVAVANVQVVAGDLSKTFATTAAHGSIGMEAATGETFVMFTSRFAVFNTQAVPQGSGTLKGIASVNNVTYQILPTVLEDAAGMTGARFGVTNTLTVTPGSIQFEAASGNTQTITVDASGAWTAITEGTGFTINPASGTGNGTVTATASAASGASGKIVFTLTGTAITKEVTVSQKTAVGGNVIFSEDFATVDGTGGSDDNWASSVAGNSLNSHGDWTLVRGYKGYQCLKLGTGSAQGSAQTPALTGLSGNAVLTFRAAAWNGTNEQTELLLEIEGGGSLSQPSVTIEKGKFNDFTVNITGGTSATKITFKGKQASNARFFLDDVVVTKQ